MRNRVLSAILTMSMLLTIFPAIPVSAANDEDTPQLVIESKTAKAGETVSVNVSVRNNPGIMTFSLGFDYDSGLTLQSVKKADGLEGMLNYKQTAVYVQSTDITEDRDLLVLTFAVSPEAVGEQRVEIVFAEASNQDEEDVAFSLEGGSVTVEREDAYYTVTVTNGTGSDSYAAGASVTITADPPAADKQFAGWTGADGLIFTSGDATSATATFTMPAEDVELSATYEDESPQEGDADAPQLVVESKTAEAGETVSVNVSIRNNPGIMTFQLRFAYDSGLTLQSVTKAADLKGILNYGQTAVYIQNADITEDRDLLTLTFLVSPEAVGEQHMKIAFAEASNQNEENVVLSLVDGCVTVTHTVVVTNGTGSGSYAEGAAVSIAADVLRGKAFVSWSGADGLTFVSGDATSATATFTMPVQAVELTATYEDVYYAVTVENGDGNGSYTMGTSVTITADAPPEGKKFTSWSGADTLTFTDGSATSATATFTMPDAAVTLTATYEDVYYAVTVENGDGNGSYTMGTSVTITANAQSGKVFAGWSGADGLIFTSGDAMSATATFTMPARIVTLAATYEDERTTLTIGESMSGEIAQANGYNWYVFTAPFAGEYVFTTTGTLDTRGELHTSMAGPSVAYDDDSGSGYNFKITRAMSENETIYLKVYAYSRNTGSYTVSVLTDYRKLTVVGGTGSGSYAKGASVTVAADAAPDGKMFAYWSGADTLTFTDGSATSAIATFTMPDAMVVLTATYEDITYAVTVTNGAGSGNYAEGTSVTITAAIPAAGKRFVGWTGTSGLTFTSGSATSATATFTMPAQAVDLTATYEDQLGAPTISTIQALDSGRIQITVTRPNGASGEVTYNVWRSTDSSSGFANVGSFTSSNSSYTWTDSRLTPNTTYYYKISAYQMDGMTQVDAPDSEVKNAMTTSDPAVVLTIDQSVSGTIAYAQDYNWYLFIAPSAGEYIFTTTGSLDTVGYLYTSMTGSSVASDDDSGTGRNFYLVRTMAESETIYLKVRAYDNKTGSYAVSVSKMSVESVTELSIEESVSGMINHARGYNWYSFTAPSAGEYLFTTTGSLDTMGYLYTDMAGSSVASDDDSGTGRNFLLIRTMSSNETIYLKVRAYSSNTGSYSLSISPVGTASTTELSVGGSVSGTIAYAQSHNWYSFTAPSAGEYLFTTTGSLDTMGYLHTSMTGSSVASDDDSGTGRNFQLIRTMSGNETIYLKVRAYSGNTGSYSLSVSRIGAASVTELSIGESASGTIAYAQSYNWYSFTAPSAGEYLFTTAGALDTLGYLYTNMTGSSVASDDDSGTGRNFLLIRTMSGNETIYLKVRAYGSNTGAYNVSVSQVGTASATELSVGRSINGTIAYAQGYNWYLFTAPSAGQYVFTTTGSLDTMGYLYTSMSGSSVASDDDSGSGRNFQLTRTMSAGETIYLKVRAYSTKTGSYSVLVSQQGAASPTPTSTTSLTTGGSVSGSISQSGDYNWYSFTAPSAGQYTFTTTGSLDTIGELYTSMTGSRVAVDDDSGTGTNFRLTRYMSGGETVYLKVRAYNTRTGAYTVSVSR